MSLNEQIRLACRQSFLAYCKLMSDDFIIAQHHKTISKYLMKIAQGEALRLIISLPPRHGKSYMISQNFPTWFLGLNPTKQVIATSYGASLAQDFGNWVRNTMVSENYATVFPNVKIDKSSKSKREFLINGDQGRYFAVGMGGAITGRGGDLLLIDDPIKNQKEAMSFTYRKNVIDYYTQTLRTRLMPNGSIVIVMTRWHEEDLAGHILENNHEGFEYIKFPAIQPDGTALWPERYPIEELENLKKTMTPMAFEGLYQQSPVQMQGNKIKKDWILYFDELPKVFDRKIITIDTAFKGNPDSDYNVMQCWGIKGNQKFCIDQIRGQFDFVQLCLQVKIFSNRYPNTRIYIEDSANASALISQMKKEIPNLKTIPPKGSKEFRLESVAHNFSNHEVLLNPQFTELVDELMIFPNGKNDDQVDTLSLALSILQNSAPVKIFKTDPSRLERRF